LPVAVGSAVAGYLVAAGARVVFGPAAGRRGAARGVTLGAGVAVAGILLLGLAPTDWLSGAGLVLAAGGISMCWPLLLAHASDGRARPAAIVGSVTAVGYLGFVLGPTVVGWVAAAFGLRAGLLLLAGAAAFVAAAPTRGGSGSSA
jgi:MFS family permease